MPSSSFASRHRLPSEILICNFPGWVCERISKRTHSWDTLLSDENKADCNTGNFALTILHKQGASFADLYLRKVGAVSLILRVCVGELTSKLAFASALCMCTCHRGGRENMKMPLLKRELPLCCLTVETKRWAQTRASDLCYVLFKYLRLIHWRMGKTERRLSAQHS